MSDRPKPITLVFPYYENPGMLAHQLANIESYDVEIRQHLHLIVVDDGSPHQPAQIPSCAIDFKLFRCLVDKPWNWAFCRNLALSQTETEWALLTDIDHLLPVQTARALVYGLHEPNHAYIFSRVSAPALSPYKPHVNSWFLTRALYDSVGGYDERFSGLYGMDKDFRRRLRENTRLLSDALIRIPRSVVPDASTTTLSRVKNRAKIARVLRKRGKAKPARLTCPWQRVR